ncbi:MAG: hypothetical protein IJV04_08470 [Lachnospiraceae bacterium]|nr:hypothetical protein [Lachnospiraceae bacterium]
MNRLGLFLLTGTLAVSLCACGGTKGTSDSTSSPAASDSEKTKTAEASDMNTLVFAVDAYRSDEDDNDLYASISVSYPKEGIKLESEEPADAVRTSYESLSNEEKGYNIYISTFMGAGSFDEDKEAKKADSKEAGGEIWDTFKETKVAGFDAIEYADDIDHYVELLVDTLEPDESLIDDTDEDEDWGDDQVTLTFDVTEYVDASEGVGVGEGVDVEELFQSEEVQSIINSVKYNGLQKNMLEDDAADDTDSDDLESEDDMGDSE